MQINHRDLYIERHGDPNAPAILLLHHGLGSTQAWKAQVPAFTAAGYQLILYDRWGYGRSEARSYLAVPGFEDDLADLRAIIETARPPSLVLLGHSDGGTIALYQALQDPGSVDALVVVASHIYLEPKMGPGIQGIRQAFEHDMRFRTGLQRAHGEKYESTFYNWYDGWHTPQALTWDMRPLLKGIRCPTLVVQGEADEHAAPQHAMDIAANIPSAELWLVPGAGHMLPQEMAEAFNRKVLGFLEGRIHV
jgi:pimeloyl-ACP methyl ester carboxylesterase